MSTVPTPFHTDMKILSWNVNDIRTRDEGLKTANPDFIRLIQAGDLICLQETKAPIKIAGFRCHN